MATIFGLHQKKEKNLILIIIAVLVIGGIIIGFILKEKPAPLFLEVPKPALPKINFEVLENPYLEILQSLQVIPPFTGEVGRENPFLPY